MLATYNTYLRTQNVLQTLIKEHKDGNAVLRIAYQSGEDFLSIMRAKRIALAERAEFIQKQMKKTIAESEKLLRKSK